MESLRKKADAERSAEAEKKRMAKLQMEMERVKAAKDKEENAKLEDEKIRQQYDKKYLLIYFEFLQDINLL